MCYLTTLIIQHLFIQILEKRGKIVLSVSRATPPCTRRRYVYIYLSFFTFGMQTYKSKNKRRYFSHIIYIWHFLEPVHLQGHHPPRIALRIVPGPVPSSSFASICTRLPRLQILQRQQICSLLRAEPSAFSSKKSSLQPQVCSFIIGQALVFILV